MIKYEPGAYWFGISYESDIAYASRTKKRREFIEAVNKAWGRV